MSGKYRLQEDVTGRPVLHGWGTRHRGHANIKGTFIHSASSLFSPWGPILPGCTGPGSLTQFVIPDLVPHLVYLCFTQRAPFYSG